MTERTSKEVFLKASTQLANTEALQTLPVNIIFERISKYLTQCLLNSPLPVLLTRPSNVSELYFHILKIKIN